MLSLIILAIQADGQDLCSEEVHEGSNSLGIKKGAKKSKKECYLMGSVQTDLKKRNSLTPKPQGQLLQVPNLVSTIVAESRQGTQTLDQVSRRSSSCAEDFAPN